MNYKHYLAIALIFVAILVVYIFGNTTKPKDLSKIPAKTDQSSSGSMDMLSAIDNVNKQLNKDTLSLITSLLNNKSDSKNIDSIATIYNVAGFPGIAAYYLYENAKEKKELSRWLKAGEQNYETARVLNSPETSEALFKNALECYKKAVELAPENTSYQVKLAQCYMDGTPDAMIGVAILRDIVSKDSNNIEAQFTLGRFGIVSQQYDKAIKRLEKVVSLQPSNADAYLLLGEAYEKSGDIKMAVSSLEKARKLINDPSFNKEIANYIDQLKKNK
jgi:tetratricopeptide (TPR) repeat protein